MLLLPPTRTVVIRAVRASRVARFMTARFVVRGPGRRPGPGADVEGTATEYPPTDPPRIER